MGITKKNKKLHIPKIELNKSSNLYLMKILNKYNHLLNQDVSNEQFMELMYRYIKIALVINNPR